MSKLAQFLVEKYNPNQERDYHGRFGSGGGGTSAATEASDKANRTSQRAKETRDGGTHLNASDDHIAAMKANKKNPKVAEFHRKAAVYHLKQANQLVPPFLLSHV